MGRIGGWPLRASCAGSRPMPLVPAPERFWGVRSRPPAGCGSGPAPPAITALAAPMKLLALHQALHSRIGRRAHLGPVHVLLLQARGVEHGLAGALGLGLRHPGAVLVQPLGYRSAVLSRGIAPLRDRPGAKGGTSGWPGGAAPAGAAPAQHTLGRHDGSLSQAARMTDNAHAGICMHACIARVGLMPSAWRSHAARDPARRECGAQAGMGRGFGLHPR